MKQCSKWGAGLWIDCTEGGAGGEEGGKRGGIT